METSRTNLNSSLSAGQTTRLGSALDLLRDEPRQQNTSSLEPPQLTFLWRPPLITRESVTGSAYRMFPVGSEVTLG